MPIDRRTLLASPLVFGLRELFAQDAVVEPLDWLEAAKARMAETGRCGVVIVVPEPEALRWGTALHDLMEGGPDPAKGILCEAVFICMTSTVADARVRRAGERHNRILLAPDGTRLGADTIEIARLAPDEFARSFGGFIRVERRPAPTVEQRDALRRLESEDIKERDAASALLTRDSDKIIPLLAHEGRTANDPEVAARCHAIVLAHFAAARAETWGPRLPYGCRLSSPVLQDPCPTCGRGSIPIKPRRFFQFLKG